MKTIKFFALLFMLATISLPAVAQTAGVPNEVVAALHAGDANKLAPHFNNNVELIIGNTNDVYSKQQAVVILTDFFKKNKVSGFSVSHRGDKDNANFIIGTLKTSAGTFRVYVFTRKTEGKALIQQLRIETE